MSSLNADQFKPTPEDKKHYNRGWNASKRPPRKDGTRGALDAADDRGGEHPAWHAGYTDYAIGLDKYHSLSCEGHWPVH